VLIAGLLASMAIEPTLELTQQNERIAAMKAELDEIEDTNQRLERRLERLDDPDFIEQKAREQLGLVRPGETTYHVVPPGTERDKAEKKKREAPPPAPPDPGFAERLLEFVGLS
jgi:cell division protein FtsB